MCHVPGNEQVWTLETFKHAYFGQLKGRYACFSSKIHLSTDENALIGHRFVPSVTVFS